MKLKTKILKNLISVLCAATILTSSVAPSVGAFKEAPNAEEGVVDRVKSANQALGLLKYKINDMLQKTRGESDKYKGTMNDRDKTDLENSARMVNEFEEVVINDLKLVENIERELVSALSGWEHSDSVSNMSAKLENINSMIQKHKQQQAKEENPEAEAEKENTIKEFRNVEEKFIDIYKDFTNWKKGNKEIAKVYEVSKVKEIRRQVGRLYDEKFYNKNDVGVEGAKEFIKLARLAIQQMEDFKEKYEQDEKAKAEQENTINEFRDVKNKFIDIYNDFTNWKKGNKEIAKVYEVSKVKEIRRQVGRLYDEKFNNKNVVCVGGAKEFIELARPAIKQMEDFKEKYEQDEKAKALGGILTNLDKKNALTNKKRAFAKLKANAEAKAEAEAKAKAEAEAKAEAKAEAREKAEKQMGQAFINVWKNYIFQGKAAKAEADAKLEADAKAFVNGIFEKGIEIEQENADAKKLEAKAKAEAAKTLGGILTNLDKKNAKKLEENNNNNNNEFDSDDKWGLFVENYWTNLIN